MPFPAPTSGDHCAVCTLSPTTVPPHGGCPDVRSHHERWQRLGLSSFLPTAALQQQDKGNSALDLVSGLTWQQEATPASTSRCRSQMPAAQEGREGTVASPRWEGPQVPVPFTSLPHREGHWGLWAALGLAHTPREYKPTGKACSFRFSFSELLFQTHSSSTDCAANRKSRPVLTSLPRTHCPGHSNSGTRWVPEVLTEAEEPCTPASS